MLHHPGGETFELFRNRLQVLIVVLQLDRCRTGHVGIDSRNAQAPFVVLTGLLAPFQYLRIDDHPLEILQVGVHVFHPRTVNDYHPPADPYLGSGKAASVSMGKGVLQVPDKGG